MIFIKSPSYSPYFNLALEEYIFENKLKNEDYFILWQNHNTIVVGKYQNTAQEINLNYVNDNNINVVRRLSGGGAVYHDLGNLNFTFITQRSNIENFNFKYFTLPIINSLKKLDINAQFNSRNDLAIDNKKFSGNSQYIKGSRVLHHGTLLINSNLNKIQDALNVKESKYISKGVKSVKGRVCNINDFLDNKISIDEFCNILLNELSQEEDIEHYNLTKEDLYEVEKLYTDKYSTWEWNFGFSPKYNVKKERKLNCGNMTVYLNVEQGIIKDFNIYGDFFGYNKEIEKLENMFVGCKINKDELYCKLDNVKTDDYINNLDKDDLLSLVLS